MPVTTLHTRVTRSIGAILLQETDLTIQAGLFLILARTEEHRKTKISLLKSIVSEVELVGQTRLGFQH